MPAGSARCKTPSAGSQKRSRTASWAAPPPKHTASEQSVRDRLGGTFHHDRLGRNLFGFELQAELVLQGAKDIGAAGLGGSAVRRFLGVFELVAVGIVEAG